MKNRKDLILMAAILLLTAFALWSASEIYGSEIPVIVANDDGELLLSKDLCNDLCDVKDPDPAPDPVPDPGKFCPEGAYCFSHQEFIPTADHPVRRYAMAVPDGKYERVVVVMFVTLPNSTLHDGRYNFFWLAINGKNRDMLGYLMALPGHPGIMDDSIRLRHGIGVRQSRKVTVNGYCRLEPGGKYRITHDYDIGNQFAAVRVDHLGGDSVTLESVPNVQDLEISGVLTMDIGFPGNVEDEYSSIGWKYEGIVVMVYGG